MTVRKSQLEDAYDKLVEHCYELTETDFEPVTAPQVMAEYLNKQMSELLNTADTTMARYEDKVKDAESYLSPSRSTSTSTPSLPNSSATHSQTNSCHF